MAVADDAPSALEGPEPLPLGWYRSPGGHPAHADGPSQARAYTDQGWQPIGEDEAKQLIAESVDLIVDSTDAKGTFDADAVNTAVREEAVHPRGEDGRFIPKD